MKYEVVIPLDVVDFTDLNDLVEGVCGLSGRKAEVKRQLVVVTDDLNLSLMFENFRSTLQGNGRKEKAVISKQSSGKKSPRKQSIIGGSSRRIVETGEILSLVALKKRIQAGEVEERTVIEDKHGERFVVMDGELIKEPQ